MKTTAQYNRDKKNSIATFVNLNQQIEMRQSKLYYLQDSNEAESIDSLHADIEELTEKQRKLIEAMDITYGICFWSVIESEIYN